MRSQVLPYLRALSSCGIRFCFMSFEKGFDKTAEISRELEDCGIGWIKLKFHSRPVLLAKLFDVKIGSIAAFWTCITKKVDIVHARGIMGALVSLFPAKITGAKFIFDMKSSLAEAYRLSGKIDEKGVYYRSLVYLERLCVSLSDVVIVETEVHRDSLSKMLSAKKRRPDIVVLPCCVETARFDLKGEPMRNSALMDSVRLAYLGSLSGWYMIPEMLSFFKYIKARYKNAQMLFITDDKDSMLKNAVKENNLEDVSVVKADYDDVPKLLTGSSFGILFKWPCQRLDSFPIKVGEYLASGLPVIINAGMGDVEAIIRRNKIGVVVDNMDSAGLEKAFRDMGSLLSEGDAVRQRCKDVAARCLSSSSAVNLLRSVYGF